MNDDGPFFLGMFLGFLLGCIVGGIGFGVWVSSDWQTQAVEHNAAHWETASDGSTTFVWDEEVSE